MAYYKVDKIIDPRYTHNMLIVPPLAVILVSCFIFVLVQSPVPAKVAPTASTGSTPTLNQPRSILPMAQVSTLPTLEPVVTIDKNSSSVGSSINTTTPQPTTSASSSLQSATSNNQSLTYTIKMHITSNTKSNTNKSNK